jgi:hypothetical protein
MIKIQKLNYNAAGLFASSLAAILVSFIPYGGAYLSYVVLVICLWKCTGADIAPDVIFTVGIAGALMFCFNLWVIGMLMGSSLRKDFSEKDAGGKDTEMVAEEEEDEETDSEEPAAAPAAQRPVRAPTKPALASTNGVRVSARTPAPAKPPPPIVDVGPLTIKGISFGARAAVMISDGFRVHTVGLGESFAAELPKGRTRLRCEEITKTNVVFKNSEGQLINVQLP